MQKLKVVKIGGNIIDDEQTLLSFLEAFAGMASPKILVHGGGKLATKLATQMDVPVKMIEGRRITDADTLDIITMVYGGKINKSIVASLQGFGCNALGFTGADGNLIQSDKRPVKNIDFGFVGDIKSVNRDLLVLLLNQGITPVLSAITHDGKGQLLNTNADTVASEVAIACASTFETELYYCFEKKGVLSDISDEQSVIETIDTETYKQLLNEGVIAEGMLPKMTNCFHAIEHKVHKIGIGQTEMLFKDQSLYTTIIK